MLAAELHQLGSVVGALPPLQFPQAIGHLGEKCQQPRCRKRRDEKARTRPWEALMTEGRDLFSIGLGSSAVQSSPRPAACNRALTVHDEVNASYPLAALEP
jgi:hypothetical protein